MFHRGALELQVAEGAEFSLQTTSIIQPNIDYELTILRLGYMVDDPHGSNFLRGNNEFMLEVAGGPIIQRAGFGARRLLSVVYRRNFLSPGARVIPYLDLGAGGVYSSTLRTTACSRSLARPSSYFLQAGAGVRFLG